MCRVVVLKYHHPATYAESVTAKWKKDKRKTKCLSAQCLTRCRLLFTYGRIHLRRLLGALRILIISGNAGTGTYQRGAEEHGCDFAPFAIYKRIISKFLEPLAAGVVFAMGEQKAHPVKAAVRHLHYHFPFRSHHNNKCKGE